MIRISPSRNIRVATFGALIFVALGVYLPFFPLLLQEKGFSAGDLGLLISAPLIAKIWITPVLIAKIGVFGDRRISTFLYTLLAFLLFSSLALVSDYWVIFAVLIIFGVFWHALIPISDAFALTEVRLNGVNYGHLRLWGSAAFIVGNIGAGFLLEGLPGASVHNLIACLIGLLVLWCFFLPDEPRSVAHGATISHLASRSVRSASSQPKSTTIYIIICAAALIQASHALIYAFGTIHWINLGFSSAMIGNFWAIGVVAEIVLLSFGHRFVSFMSPIGLIILGGLAAMVRWSLHVEVTSLSGVILLQILHAFTFAATHLGLQSYIAEKTSERETPKAQAMIAFVSGILMALLTLLSGPLYEAFEGRSFYLMAFISMAGVLVLISGYALYPHKREEGG